MPPIQFVHGTVQHMLFPILRSSLHLTCKRLLVSWLHVDVAALCWGTHARLSAGGLPAQCTGENS
eukprot:1696798-Amphidinium_carterae.1